MVVPLAQLVVMPYTASHVCLHRSHDVARNPYHDALAFMQAVLLAQLVVMPYTVLLQKASRQAMGVRLKNSVVIIDEAHNIAEAVNAVHR